VLEGFPQNEQHVAALVKNNLFPKFIIEVNLIFFINLVIKPKLEQFHEFFEYGI
jgi:hypothetical protein